MLMNQLRQIRDIGQDFDVPQIWHFGSSAFTQCPQSAGDIDIAFVGLRFEQVQDLTAALRGRFSGSRVQAAGEYSRTGETRPNTTAPPFHFVISTTEDWSNSDEAILRSIRKGYRLA
jgi:hypothetical protein